MTTMDDCDACDVPSLAHRLAAVRGHHQADGMDVFYLGLRTAALVCPHLPVRVGRGLFERVGAIAFHLSRNTRAVCLANLRHILGPGATEANLLTTGRQAFRHLALSYYDILRAHAFSDAEILGEFSDVRGLHWVEEALQGGRGAIFATAHFGSFNLLGHLLAAQLRHQLIVLYTPQGTPRFSSFVHALRARGAVQLLPLKGTLRTAVAALRAGQALGMFLDPDCEQQGPAVNFFDAAAHFPVGAVSLALKYDAPLVIGFSVRQADGRSALHVEPPLHLEHSGDRARDVHAGLCQIAALMEPYVRQHPAQWSHFERVWSD